MRKMEKKKSQTIGEIIENLIYVKDYCDIRSLDILDSINNACNILSHNFNRFATADVLINECITSIRWQHEDIMSALADDGFEPNEDNVDIILNHPGLEKYIQERGIENGWDIIHGVISEHKDELLVLQTDGLEE